MIRTTPSGNNVHTKKNNNGNGNVDIEGNGLTPRQKKFVDYYIEMGSAIDAYYKAGYKGKNDNVAYVTAYQLLRNTKIQKYVQERNAQLSKERVADIEEVKEFWTNVVRDPETKMQDRLKASEFIAKTNGAFIDKMEHTGKDGGPIEVNSPREQIASRIAGIASRTQEEEDTQ